MSKRINPKGYYANKAEKANIDALIKSGAKWAIIEAAMNALPQTAAEARKPQPCKITTVPIDFSPAWRANRRKNEAK